MWQLKGDAIRYALIIKEIQRAWGATRYQVACKNKKMYVWDKHLKSIKGEKDDKSRNKT